MIEQTKEEAPNYTKMKEEAGEFAKLLIKWEQNFSQEINDCGDGLAVYFNIEGMDNKIITIHFKDNGYVGFGVKGEE